MREVDLFIRGGLLVDGLGTPLQRADVGVVDGKIAFIDETEVPANLTQAKEVIDAQGAVVTPGFIDIHTHYDGQAVWDSHLASSSWHGVTTAVMGNCGVGFAPVRPHDRERLIELMEGVEDIPGVALHEGLDWAWESFADYLKAVERRQHDMDIGAQLPHGALRVYTMGERAARLEAANENDMAQMRELATQAMRDGALGFSTSRTINHKSVKGEPTPSLRAAEAELTAIAMGLSDAGHGVLQVVSDFNTPSPEEEFAMLRRIVEKSGRPLSFSLAQNNNRPEGWRVLLKLLNEAVDDGLPMRAQVAPRAIGMLMGLQASRNPFWHNPEVDALGRLPMAERKRIMADPAFRQKVLDFYHDTPEKRRYNFHHLFPLSDPPNYEPPVHTSIGAQAERMGRDAAELAYDLLFEDDGHALYYETFANYASGDLRVCREMIAEPNTLIGLGDGGAHVGLISDASFPSYLMSRWAKECGNADGFDLSWLIKRQTSDAARFLGLKDRGVVAPGMKADLNVINIDQLHMPAPRMKHDLPAGGKRLLQPATGYLATVVSGQVTQRQGEFTGQLPGRLLYGPKELAAA